jgi:XTP/dITP diphosphohydrolase
MELLVATTNKGKINEIKELLQDDSGRIELLSLEQLAITTDCPETGESFKDNALQKSLFYSQIAKGIYTIGDDSGLMVDALGGEPGVHSARYAGQKANDQKNMARLLKRLGNASNKKAKFVTVVTLSRNGIEIKSFFGEAEGIILEKGRGSKGFGYDPIFFYPPLKKTFAELTTKEKNRVSHRAIAFKKLKDYLLENYFS